MNLLISNIKKICNFFLWFPCHFPLDLVNDIVLVVGVSDKQSKS